MEIGIIGVGVVGGATAKVFSRVHNLHLYDKYKNECNDVEGLVNSEVVFVCVPTPMKSSGEIDYSAVYDSVEFLHGEVIRSGKRLEDILVAIRSTAVSGTTDKLAQRYSFKFAFNPEFLRERHALEDMEDTDRVVIGANDEDSIEKMLAVYKPLFPDARYVLVDRKTAEMVKYVANVFLASQVAIANEIYGICQALGVDYDAVKNTVLLDGRIARNIDVPGPDGDFGFGGKCFPKDLNALIYLARENMYRPHLLEEVWRLNEKIRRNKDWLDIPGATSENNDFKKE